MRGLPSRLVKDCATLADVHRPRRLFWGGAERPASADVCSRHGSRHGIALWCQVLFSSQTVMRRHALSDQFWTCSRSRTLGRRSPRWALFDCRSRHHTDLRIRRRPGIRWRRRGLGGFHWERHRPAPAPRGPSRRWRPRRSVRCPHRGRPRAVKSDRDASSEDAG